MIDVEEVSNTICPRCSGTMWFWHTFEREATINVEATRIAVYECDSEQCEPESEVLIDLDTGLELPRSIYYDFN